MKLFFGSVKQILFRRQTDFWFSTGNDGYREILGLVVILKLVSFHVNVKTLTELNI